MHEKVHVFQRWFKELCRVIYAQQGFQIIGKRVGFRDPEIRSNPDLDEFVYSQHGTPCYVRYVVAEGMRRGMRRTETVGPCEHPNEWMAYSLSN
jgi:hypothetical protein